jgi:16S rRNA (guanine527-N7)-methyltransferase
MKNLFIENGINITDKQYELFEKYYEILVSYNQKVNVTAITEKKDVFIKHFIDSILSTDKLIGENLLDVGSGGGFPAIPIKIIRDDISVLMLEATNKKCEFLRLVISELGLKNINVICGRAEDLAKNADYREKFDITTARAVARLNTLLEYVLPFNKVGGNFYAFKSLLVEEEIKESQNALKILGGKISEVKNYDLYENKRSIVIINKEKSTPIKYPRGNGKERKNPL